MTGKKLTDHPTDKVISEKKQSYPKYQIKNRRAILPNILPFQPQTLRVIDLQYFYFQYLAEVQIVEFSQFIIFSGLCPAKFIWMTRKANESPFPQNFTKTSIQPISSAAIRFRTKSNG